MVKNFVATNFPWLSQSCDLKKRTILLSLRIYFYIHLILALSCNVKIEKYNGNSFYIDKLYIINNNKFEIAIEMFSFIILVNPVFLLFYLFLSKL